MDDSIRRAIEADCTRLINRYANLNDAQDWEGCAALYAEDGRFARPSGSGEFVEGRAAILASFHARKPRAQRHVMANIVIEVESETSASGFSAIILYVGEPTGDGSLPAQAPNSPLVGWYRDRFVKTPEGWRFAERVGGLDFRP